jgi:UDP-N-acetylglucosamine:LPS N-acetylglucosamine transferase
MHTAGGGAVGWPPVRVLILSADIGAGHDAPARSLRDAIHARDPDAVVEVVDTVAAAGPVARTLVRSGSELVLRRLPWLFELQYALVARWSLTRGLAQWLAWTVGRRGLARAIRAAQPDVVVCTYPVANLVLAFERLRGRLEVPLVSAVTDLAALHYWAHHGCDLHLVIHPESAAEIRSIAGPAARILAVRGLSDAAFEEPADAGTQRVALGFAQADRVVTVSGGGWGVGDLRGALQAALAAGPDVRAVALCGHNDALRATLQATYARDARVLVLGFTDRMPEVLGATDVLVHSTAGLTVQEALVRGARVISYGWGVGHLRFNNAAYRRFGLADVVTDRGALTTAIRRGLDSPREPDLAFGQLPSAADAVLDLAAGR